MNDFGSGHPFGGQGSSASEIPPMYRPAASAGGPDRVSDQIPFRRPGSYQDPRSELQEALRGEIHEELHAADPVVPGRGASPQRLPRVSASPVAAAPGGRHHDRPAPTRPGERGVGDQRFTPRV